MPGQTSRMVQNAKPKHSLRKRRERTGKKCFQVVNAYLNDCWRRKPSGGEIRSRYAKSDLEL